MSRVDHSLFIRALKREPVGRTPLWFMRQAGRYLPEYRAVRKKAKDFMILCKTPELACEVTLQPIQRFGLDAAILFSDILTIPDALGLGLTFKEGEGPVFQFPLKNPKDISKFSLDTTEEKLFYVRDAVQLIRKNLPETLPLIGFSGSPWTLACYMVEGQSNPGFPAIKAFMKQEPLSLHQLLEFLAKAVTHYLVGQIKAGANALMIFDTWGSLLSKADYLIFSLVYMKHIIQDLKARYPEIPLILFTKNSRPWLQEMALTGCDALSIDWSCSLQEARSLVGERVALQGNLDPAVLLTDEENIILEVQKVLASYGKGSGHIFNLGHGITPEVPPEHVAIMVEAVKHYSPAFHQL